MGDCYREYIKRRRKGHRRGIGASGGAEDIERAKAIKAQAARKARKEVKVFLIEGPDSGSTQMLL